MEVKVRNESKPVSRVFEDAWPIYQLIIHLTASEEELSDLQEFELWNLPLTVRLEDEKVVKLINPRTRPHPAVIAEDLTLNNLINGGYGIIDSDPMKVLASKNLVLACINQVEDLLTELKTLRG